MSSMRCHFVYPPQRDPETFLHPGDTIQASRIYSPKQSQGLSKLPSSLLATPKAERLRVTSRQQKESTRGAVKQQIFDVLYGDQTGLPVEQYGEEGLSDYYRWSFSVHIFSVHISSLP